MNFDEYPDREMLILDVANIIADELVDDLHHQDRVTLAVPGGTTPGPIFDELAGIHMDWDRVNIMLTDERWVPLDSDRSNTRLLRERLLVDQAAAANYMPLYEDVPMPEDGIPHLSAALKPYLPISVLLLGMGADMHTASLFPNTDGIATALAPNAPPLVPVRPDNQPEARVSLSAPVLKGAINTHLVIFGAEKRAALERADKLPVEDAPINLVLKNATVHWAE